MLYAILSPLKCKFLLNAACSPHCTFFMQTAFFWGKEKTFKELNFTRYSKIQVGSSHIPILSILEIKKIQCAVILANTSINVENNIEYIHTYIQEQMGALLFITLSCLANFHFLNKATYRYHSCNFSLWNISI